MPIDSIQFYGLWIQAGAIVASGVGVIVAMFFQRGIARRRATLDFLLLEQTNAALTEQRRKFVEMREKGNLEQWAAKAHLASPEATLIRSMFNIYELVAIGIAEKTIDEEIYKRWYRTTLVKDWIAAKAFVATYQRDHNRKLFCEFQELAKSWANVDERKLL
jgi:hypothetical protein